MTMCAPVRISEVLELPEDCEVAITILEVISNTGGVFTRPKDMKETLSGYPE